MVPPEVVSRTPIGRLDTTDVAMACVSYLNSSGTMAPLRHLLRRLRQRAPTIPIVVGLWSPGQPVSESDRQRTVGANDCVASLRDAVTICLETLRTASEATELPVTPPPPAA